MYSKWVKSAEVSLFSVGRERQRAMIIYLFAFHFGKGDRAFQDSNLDVRTASVACLLQEKEIMLQ